MSLSSLVSRSDVLKIINENHPTLEHTHLNKKAPNYSKTWEKHHIPAQTSTKLTYLDLRSRQNLKWANASVLEAIKIEESGDVKSALKKYTSALEIAPDCIEALIARGMNYYKAKEFKQAQKDFKHALGIDGGNGIAREQLEETRARIREIKASRNELLNGGFVMESGDREMNILNALVTKEGEMPIDKTRQVVFDERERRRLKKRRK